MPGLNCVAIVCSGKNIGTVCNKGTLVEKTRCRVHDKSFESKGPHTTARDELKAVHNKEVLDIYANPNLTDEQKEANRRAIMDIQDDQRRALYRTQREYEAIHGNPDAPAKARAAARYAAARVVRQERIQAIMLAHNAHVERLGAAVRIAPVVGPTPRELAAFASDNQNVHTSHAVQQTKDIIKKILEIHVPAEYRWNMTECSKTPGEIITMCKLTPTAAWQMAAKYCQAEEIYEMGKGIYGRVLDCVWQFILASPDKDDLVKIVKAEMQDNIGMCAQGNLSRLCNILSGYLDGIVIRESPAEIMGRLIVGILNISDVNERAKKMTEALIEAKMPLDKWYEWAEQAFDGDVLVTNNRIQIMA
jgi:hypothetical protein